jgi:aspartyl-tRNA(Asn)/glutamyl-tRNA(Gln) amidotransferase subunit A
MTASCDTIAETAAAVRRGDIKAEAVVGRFLARIAARAERLGTFVEVTAEAALERARDIDRQVARGEDPGPLAGVPIANKDLLFRGGGAMSAGSPLISGESFTTTATVARRLQAAGAVDVGRLALAEFALSPVGDNAHFGPVRNPWDEARVSGGSSSGSGAAVADGQVLAALGSDTAGSIRLPAAMSGVTGLKPTYGRVSRAGVFPLAPSLDTLGPLARSAADCAAMLAVIAGEDARDATTLNTPAPHYELPSRPPSRPPARRVALARRVIEETCTPDVVKSVMEAVDTLRAAGIEVVETDIANWAELGQLTVLILSVEAAAVHARRLDETSDMMGTLVRDRIALGRAISAPAYLDALRLRGPLLRTFLAEVLSGCDALVLATTPAVAPLIEDICEVPAKARGLDRRQLAKDLAPVGSLTRGFNFLGVPALSLPVSTGAHGLPVGLQLVGRPFAEATILEIAATFQSLTDWHTRRPPAAGPV